MRIRSLFLLLFTLGANAQIKTIEPKSLVPLPEIDLVECERLSKLSDKDYDKFKAMSPKEQQLVVDASEDTALSHFYSESCSWYCGGLVGPISASSSLSEKYKAENIHDFCITTAWVEGEPGNGEGEYIMYSFPAICPRITAVSIHNGYIKDKRTWKNNGRVKKLLMYYNDEPYAILNLQDTRDCQTFDVGVLGFHDFKEDTPDWTIKFEILEVYPGDKYQDTAITEIYFDGIDVH